MFFSFFTSHFCCWIWLHKDKTLIIAINTVCITESSISIFFSNVNEIRHCRQYSMWSSHTHLCKCQSNEQSFRRSQLCIPQGLGYEHWLQKYRAVRDNLILRLDPSSHYRRCVNQICRLQKNFYRRKPRASRGNIFPGTVFVIYRYHLHIGM